MTVLSADTIQRLGILSPIQNRTQHGPSGTSFGLSMCGYDIRLDQRVHLVAGRTTLASSMEEFFMPFDVVGIVHDKSTWARRGVQVQNTVIEPGWRGFLTLELSFAPIVAIGDSTDLPLQDFYMEMEAGTPIAQVMFHYIDKEVAGYDGKYQDQKRGPQIAR